MHTRLLLAYTLMATAPSTSCAQVLHLADLNAPQIRALDRQRTVVIIPGGILEEHGPYLPVYTDGFADSEYASRLASKLVVNRDWTVVMFPELPLGFGGANDMGAKYDFPGSFTVRFSTLRAVYMDVANALGRQGFRWIVVVHDHGDPAHNWALDQAGDYFRDVFGGTMLHPFGLTEVQDCYGVATRLLTPEARREDGVSVHAGAEETSEMLFLRPLLVPLTYETAQALSGQTFTDLYRIAEHPDWPGYFGAPARATAAIGSAVIDACSEKVVDVTRRVLNGTDYHLLPRFYDALDPRDSLGVKAELAHDREIEASERTWLRSKQIE